MVAVGLGAGPGSAGRPASGVAVTGPAVGVGEVEQADSSARLTRPRNNQNRPMASLYQPNTRGGVIGS